MLRDSVKNGQYFEEYLASCDKRIERFVALLPTLKNENTTGIKNCCTTITNFYRNKIVAMYSWGNSTEELREEFGKYIGYFLKSVDETAGYDSIVETLALSVLLKYDDVSLLKQILNESKMQDCLINTLMNWLGADLPESNTNLYCTWFIRFLEVAPEERAGFLKDYLKNEWYRNHKDAAWYDSHKSKVNVYVGYWSFEVGAIAKIFNISDDITWPYYPYDLVHTD